eukprot:TRINITY_DN13212_c0_g1_i1.p1 TRINITY_DN13212_c0_g1~~TRINITY_DN13212_c0_g1_i1.p1  ORF type:complete len:155 (-),score=9.11 TRINITY_DN13212_c0_g1_i1:62-526(-)
MSLGDFRPGSYGGAGGLTRGAANAAVDEDSLGFGFDGGDHGARSEAGSSDMSSYLGNPTREHIFRAIAVLLEKRVADGASGLQPRCESHWRLFDVATAVGGGTDNDIYQFMISHLEECDALTDAIRNNSRSQTVTFAGLIYSPLRYWAETLHTL